MNITGVTVKLSEDDIKSIIDDFVNIPGLTIEQIILDKSVQIKGSYKKFIKVPFKISIILIGIKPQSISFNINYVSVGFISIFKWIRNIAINILLKKLYLKGIDFKDKNINVDVKTLLGQAPYKVNLFLKSVEFKEKLVEVEVSNICINLFNKGNNLEQKEIKENIDIYKVHKVNDGYSKVRENINKNVPNQYKEIMDYIMIMPDIIALLIRLLKDKRVSVKMKIMCGGVIAYWASPLDALPDFLPIIGSMDDFALAFYVLNKMLSEIPENIIRENWQGKEDIIIVIKKGVNLLSSVIGINNIRKVIKKISYLFRHKPTDSK